MNCYTCFTEEQEMTEMEIFLGFMVCPVCGQLGVVSGDMPQPINTAIMRAQAANAGYPDWYAAHKYIDGKWIKTTQTDARGYMSEKPYRFSMDNLPSVTMSDFDGLPEFIAKKHRQEHQPPPKFFIQKFVGYWQYEDGTQYPGEIAYRKEGNQ